MNINELVEQYGYLALTIGSIAEGETITLLGGVAVHQGLLKFPFAVAAIALGGMIGDQLLFFIGHYFGERILARFSRHQDKIDKAQSLVRRHPYLFVIGSRFMYGFRIIGPIIIGASKLPPKIFIPLNILGALIWALLFTTLGYFGGEVLSPWLHNIDQQLRHWAWLIVIIVFVIAVRLWFKFRKKSPQR